MYSENPVIIVVASFELIESKTGAAKRSENAVFTKIQRKASNPVSAKQVTSNAGIPSSTVFTKHYGPSPELIENKELKRDLRRKEKPRRSGDSFEFRALMEEEGPIVSG